MIKLSGNINGGLNPAFQSLKSLNNFSKILLVISFLLLIAGKVSGQCTYTANITFTQGSDDNSETRGICGAIGGGGENDIDIYSITPAQSGATYQWEYSNVSSTGPWTIDPYTGTQFYVGSFNTSPGTYYFRLKVSTPSCTAGVYSEVITLIITGTPPSPPTGTGASRCGHGTLTLSASGCSGGTLRWYTSQFGGTLLQTGSTYTTPDISVTTTYWVSCTTSGGCESPRAAVIASITSALPATPGPITGPTPVCASSSNTYSIAAVPDASSYNWTVPAGWSITAGSGTITITATAGAAGGTISVIAVNGCGNSPGSSTLSVSVNPSGTITGTTPGSRCGTGTVTLGATASAGTITWWSAATGGSNLGTGTSFTTPSISTTTTYYVDATVGSCVSSPRVAVTATISANPTTSNAGTNQTVCGSATLAANTPAVGTGAWSVASGPSLLLSQFSNTASPTSTFTAAGGAGAYVLTWTISNPPCTASSSNVTITVNIAPVVAPITGPTGVCVGATITLSDATPGGTWSSGNTARATVTSGGVVTGVSAGSVTIYYTVSSGPCTTIVNYPITVGNGLSAPNISFDIGSDMWHRTINICGQIGGGSDATDIDIRSSVPGGATLQWQYSIVSSTGPWTTDSYTGQNWVILSFGSTPGTYYFRLIMTYNGCSVISNVIDLTVLPGSPPASPVANGTSSCNPGSFTLTASGCSGTLRWFNAPFAGTQLGTGSSYTTPVISTTTTYYVSCTTGSGNSACESPRTPVTVTIGAPANLGSITGPASVCAGQSNVAYSVTFFSGMTYSWIYSGTGATITPPGNTNSITISFSASATSGNLHVTGTSSCGTSTANDLSITVTHITPPSVGTITQPTCTVATGSVILNNLPATGTWTLTRSPGGTTSTGLGTTTTISGLPPGTYTYTVTDASGCISGSSGNIVINAQPASPGAPVPGTITQPTCALPTGSVVLNGLPVSGSWTINPGSIPGSGTTWIINGLAPGTYNFTVTNAAGCTSAPSSSVVINTNALSPAAPTVGTITQPTCVLATGSVQLTGLPSSGPWVLLQTPAAPPINGSGTTWTISGLASGTYTYQVQLVSTGCTSPSSANVVINPQPSAPAAPTASTTIQPTCTVATGTIVVTAPIGAYEYNIDGGTWQASVTFAGVTAGSHSIRVRIATDPTCVSAPTSVTVNAQPSTPAAPTVGTITQPTCSTPTGSVDLSGLPAGNWTINPGAIGGTGATYTVSGLAAGTYNFTVTNASGCISLASAPAVITAAPGSPTAPVVGTITQPTCTVATGSVQLTGLPTSGPWVLLQTPAAPPINGSGATRIVSGLAPGTYTYMVQLISSGCSSPPSANIVINPQPQAPTASISSQTNVACFGGSTGSATVTASGGASPYTYSWNTVPVQTTSTATGLAAGTYIVTVTGSNGCSTTATATIIQPAVLSASINTYTNLLCNGGSTGQATVTVTGGTAPYTYSWSPMGGTASSVNGLPAGTYTVTVTDNNSCTTTASITLTEPSAITASAAAPPILCNGGTTTITVTASGGTGTLQYSLDGITFQVGNTFAGQGVGSYTVTVRDANLCTTLTYVTIGIPPAAITVSASAPVIICGGGTTTLTVTASGGTGTLQYSLDGVNFQSSNTFPGLGTGIYTVTVRDANLCTATTTVTITSLTPISASASAPAIACAGGTTTITVTASGGTAPLEYSLDGTTFQPGNTFAGRTAGTYTITVRDANSCTLVTTLTINPGAPLPTTSVIYHQ